MSGSNVYKESGMSVFECTHGGTPFSNQPPASASISYGPGYPAVTASPCPVCKQAMGLKEGFADPAANLVSEDEYKASLEAPASPE